MDLKPKNYDLTCTIAFLCRIYILFMLNMLTILKNQKNFIALRRTPHDFFKYESF